MTDHRIVGITLDDRTVVRRSPEVEHELNVAIYDILERNLFRPDGDFQGPFRVHLSIEERRRLIFEVADDGKGVQGRMALPLLPFRRIVRDYFQICESYYDAIKRLSPSQIETIDMARRSLHDEGSSILVKRLHGKIEVDEETARRLFTLICVLHIRA
ncbi:MAG: UPF0262 family protein [Alphaproteobacteria bacterium]|nr:UPF0262 family protein [Alphaproteobacteria bacterium]